MNTSASFRTRSCAVLVIFSTFFIPSIHSMDDPRFADLYRREQVVLGAMASVGVVTGGTLCCSSTYPPGVILFAGLATSCCTGVMLAPWLQTRQRFFARVQSDMQDIEAHIASSVSGDAMRQEDARLSDCQRVLVDLQQRHPHLGQVGRAAMAAAHNDCMRLRERVRERYRRYAW